MTDLHLLYGDWGLALVFLLAFGEFIGFPVAGVPLMIAAGSLSLTQGFAFIPVVLTAAAGVWLADAIWFYAGHRKPVKVIDVACGLASNPRVCVTHVQRKLVATGPLYLLGAKLTPGVGNLAASAAGLASMHSSVFLPVNALAALLWSSVLLGCGWLGSSLIDRGLGWLGGYGRISLLVVIGLVLVATVWRVYKVRLHIGLHVREGKGR